MKKECVFCKIIRKETNSYTVYETKDIIAFFPIDSASIGHTLIVPKKHYENIYDIPDNLLKKIIIIAKKVALLYKDKLGINECNIMHASGKNAQQSVMHFHAHLVPRKENDGLNLWYEAGKKVVADFDEILKRLK
ncbi:MAG: HIT domain-containing protein [Nanoarchaeota archaeon]|nr:HIT domain-containing protein [Nanoarchaeota archaeon]